MAYQASVIQIMIASPGDVDEERKIVRSIIHEWNDVNAFSSKTMLAPIGWETHSSPELGARPQEFINNRLLKHCDLLIGVFWTKLGTPTGVAASGTVEEIEEHLALGKPAMIYFSNTPVAPESLDHAAFSDLRTFKDRCKALGLIESFDNRDDFRKKLTRHLQVCLLSNPYLISIRQQISLDIEAVDPTKISIRISADSITLLKAAASTDKGLILKREYIGGRMISAGTTQFGLENSRENARWLAALEELVDNDLVKDRSYQGQIYELTHQGWTLAEEV